MSTDTLCTEWEGPRSRIGFENNAPGSPTHPRRTRTPNREASALYTVHTVTLLHATDGGLRFARETPRPGLHKSAYNGGSAVMPSFHGQTRAPSADGKKSKTRHSRKYTGEVRSAETGGSGVGRHVRGVGKGGIRLLKNEENELTPPS